jgi:pimeloyl-ACP methyl ester carboxylesterase
MLEACGHSPHRDRPDATLEAIERFVARVAR